MTTSERKAAADALLKRMTESQEPSRRNPDCESLSGWLKARRCPKQALQEASELMNRLCRDGTVRTFAGFTKDGYTVWMPEEGRKQEKIHLTELAEIWSALPSEERSRFPLAPVTQAWLRSNSIARRDRRKTAIIPVTAKVTGHSQLEFDLASLHEPLNLGYIDLLNVHGSAHLPGMEPTDETSLVPVPLLLYDKSNMPPAKGGHGAPVSLRIWMEAMTALQVPDRHTQGRMHIKARELVSWIWPNSPLRPTRQLQTIRQAASEVNNAFVRWSNGLWLAVVIRNLPTNLDEDMILDVEPPPGSNQGPLIHRGVMRHYGATKAALYRAYLSATYLWDEYGTHAGKVIQASRPVVARDDEGFITDIKGQRVINKRGEGVRNWNHPSAVKLGAQEPNPAAVRYPLITEQEIVKIMNPTTRDFSREAKKRARQYICHMAEDGVITLEEEKRNENGHPAIKIMPPPGWGPNWDPPKTLE